MAQPAIVVIKRINKSHGGHHGGAWKVAYADFVTAMMAFFLLLWLLSNATEDQLQGISEYFTPEFGLPINTSSSIGESTPLSTQNTQNENTNPTQSSTKIIKEEEENKYFQDLEKNIKQLISRSRLSNSVIIENVTDGLSIQIIDKADPENFLFKPGNIELQNPAKEILLDISKTLQQIPRYIAISGYTTGSEDHLNPWELSAGRANSVRIFLMKSGLSKEHIARIIGKANVEPLDIKNPNSIRNRRIAIILLKNTALPNQIQNIPEINR